MEVYGIATGHVSTVAGAVQRYHYYALGKASYETFDIAGRSFRVDCCEGANFLRYSGPHGGGGDDALHEGLMVKVTYLPDGSIVKIEQL